MKIQKALKESKNHAQSLTELLEEIDTDGSHTISREEWKAALESEQILACMKALGVEDESVWDLFEMLDVFQTNEVDIHEFVRGMKHLKGPATSFDMQLVLHILGMLLNNSKDLLANKAIDNSRKSVVHEWDSTS